MSGEATIQRWAVLGNESGICLQGLVYGHPDYPDGKELTTPHITRRYLDEDGTPIYVAKNRAIYKLGTVNPDYEEDFPGSMQRIVAEIKAGVPVCPGAPVGPPGPAPQPAVIIEERAAPVELSRNGHPGNPSPAFALSPCTPVPPLIRSTERLPDVALFWWRPIEPSEKTDVERDTEDFEKLWATDPAPPEDYHFEKQQALKTFLAGCAAARARKL